MNRYKSTKTVSLLGMLSNIFLLAIKLIVAILSGSKSLIADALNSGGDIFSSLMSYIGNKVASAPSDEDHNFGHGKAEYIFSFLIGISMFLVAAKILIDCFLSVITHHEFTFSMSLIIVCVITIVLKLLFYFYCKKAYQKHHNILIEAIMKDNRNDALLSTITLLSIVLGYFGYYYFDGIIGGITSLYIMFSGISILSESYKVLMDTSISPGYKENIINDILINKEIKEVTDFYTIPTGYKYIAILIIKVDGNLKTYKSHELADLLEKEIPQKYSKIYRVIVHVNPSEL